MGAKSMITVRRVVTKVDDDGVSSVWADCPPPVVQEIPEVPGLGTYFIWSTERTPDVPLYGDDEDPTASIGSFFPPPGRSRFIIVTHPPGSGVTVGRSLRELGSGDSLQV